MRRLAAGVLAAAALAAGCGSGDADETRRLRVWVHAGQAAEREVIADQLQRFDERNDDLRLEVEFLPERSYVAQVQAAAVAGDLPDVLEIDGPYVANLAWQKRLLPLREHLDDGLVDDLLPSIRAQGRFRGDLYAVGTFDAGLALFGRRSVLEDAGVRVPTAPRESWSIDEFDDALATLAETDPDGAVLDLKLNYPQEWFAFAFMPIVESAGGSVMRRREGALRAEGALDGPDAIDAFSRVQGWFEEGFVDPNLDDSAFVAERAALSWAGHWEHARYADTFGDDLVVVPLPDFGEGTRTGQGSWMWSIARTSDAPELGARLIAFLLEPDEVLAMSRANGAVPGRREALGRSKLYAEGGPLRLLADQLVAGLSVPRPRTPAYPVVSSAFFIAFDRIRDGEDVATALQRAAETIDRDVEDNEGYPRVGTTR